jgi:hypothetical protein
MPRETFLLGSVHVAEEDVSEETGPKLMCAPIHRRPAPSRSRARV